MASNTMLRDLHSGYLNLLATATLISVPAAHLSVAPVLPPLQTTISFTATYQAASKVVVRNHPETK